MFWPLFKFTFRPLKAICWGVMASLGLLLFILFFASPLLNFTYVLVVSFCFLTIFLMLSFNQTLNDDMQDGSFVFLQSQGISIIHYFIAKCLAFGFMVGLPSLALMVLCFALFMPISEIFKLIPFFSLAWLQTIFLSAALCTTTLFHQQSQAHISLSLCLLPLQIPAILIMIAQYQHLEHGGLLWIQAGFTLFSLGLAIMVAMQALKRRS